MNRAWMVWVAGLIMAWAGVGCTNRHAADEQAAQEGALAWLALVDHGEYGRSWDEAAPVFQQAVARDKWVDMIATFRGPFGPVQSRTLRRAHYTKTLAGAPDGEYVVIQFDTRFEKKQAGVETITPMRGADGVWRISGYYIK